MGMSLSATVCVGAIIQDEDFRENDSAISEEVLEEKYDGWISEYFYDILEPIGVYVTTAGYADAFGSDSEYIAYLKNTDTGADYGSNMVDIDKLSQENIDILAEKLNQAGIKYKDLGILVFPYYG